MKKIFLIIWLLMITLGVFAQTGTGWDQVRRKSNFKDSTNFARNARFRATVTIDEAIPIDSVALLREIVLSPQTGSYELDDGDAEKLVTMNVGGANNLTVPPNSEHPFPIGTTITVVQIGAGQTTIVAHAGVTVSSAGGALKLRVQYSSCTLIKIDTDIWICVGDITV
jgi:hypothetical protein